MDRINVFIKAFTNYKKLVDLKYEGITLLIGEEVDGGYFLQYAVEVPEGEDLNENADLSILESNKDKEFTFDIGEKLANMLDIELEYF